MRFGSVNSNKREDGKNLGASMKFGCPHVRDVALPWDPHRTDPLFYAWAQEQFIDEIRRRHHDARTNATAQKTTHLDPTRSQQRQIVLTMQCEFNIFMMMMMMARRIKFINLFFIRLIGDTAHSIKCLPFFQRRQLETNLCKNVQIYKPLVGKNVKLLKSICNPIRYVRIRF